MVGGFIEQHKVWFVDDCAGEHQPVLLTTREVADTVSKLRYREAKRSEQCFSLVAGASRFSVGSFDNRIQGCELRQVRVDELLNRREAQSRAPGDFPSVGAAFLAQHGEQR